MSWESYGINIPNVPSQDTATVTPHAKVVRAYQSVLGRAPDSDGLDYWANRLISGSLSDNDLNRELATTAANFNKSTYRGDVSPDVLDTSIANARTYLRGLDVPLAPTQPNVSSTINNAYQDVLHRPADQSGVDYWANQINNGTTNQTNVANDIRNAALGNGELRTTTPASETTQTPTVVQSQAQQGMSLQNIDLANERLNRALTYSPQYENIFNPSPLGGAKGQSQSGAKGGSSGGNTSQPAHIASRNSSSMKGA